MGVVTRFDLASDLSKPLPFLLQFHRVTRDVQADASRVAHWVPLRHACLSLATHEAIVVAVMALPFTTLQMPVAAPKGPAPPAMYPTIEQMIQMLMKVTHQTGTPQQTLLVIPTGGTACSAAWPLARLLLAEARRSHQSSY